MRCQCKTRLIFIPGRYSSIDKFMRKGTVSAVRETGFLQPLTC
jgi:hypothetical protein